MDPHAGRGERGYVKRGVGCVSDSALQIAKREMQSLATNRVVWVALGATGVILGLAGPFGTGDVMRTLPRLVYWLLVAVSSFFVGSAVATLTAEGLRSLSVNRWVAVSLAGIAAGVVNFVLLLVVNVQVFGPAFLSPDALTGFAVNIVAISVIIAGAYVMIENQLGRDTPRVAEPPRLLARLPVEKRGRLISISVADHYVEVATSAGSALILMRLTDAMAETGDTPGLQVHRSHWVAIGEVTAARRDGARAILTLSDGRDIPVSRTYVPAVKEAGLLP